jgi:predicted ribosome quality control (RQC) complex YloA/Tae2 family protein
LKGGQEKVYHIVSTSLSTLGSAKIDFGSNFLNLFLKCGQHMISNHYTLQLLAADLDSSLRGFTIEDVYCQAKNELLIACGREDVHKTLVVCCDPAMNYTFLRGQANRAKKNSVDVLITLRGRIVRSIAIHPFDRELVLSCSGDVRLLIRMYGSKANALLVDEQNLVHDAFLKAKEYRGQTLPASPDDRTRPQWTIGEYHAQVRAIGTILLSAVIKKLLPMFNNILIHELCHRTHLDERRLAAELTDEDISGLFAAAEEMRHELELNPRPRVYMHNGMPTTFSLIHLSHIPDAGAEEFESIHDAIRVFVGTSRKQKTLLQERDSLLHFLRQGIERAERTLQKMEQETEALQRAQQYELYGKLLMSNLMHLQKRMREVELENIFSNERSSVRIRLDQKLTPARNAEHYFDKSKQARSGVEEKTGYQEEVHERWELLQELLDRAADVQTQEQFAEFTETRREQLKGLGYKGIIGREREPKEEAPFRIFVVTGGFQVWVGKNSENNDLLTLKYARPADLWFHARGSSGSHVVLRIGTGKGEPGRRALEEAAGIAAFYSKMKTAKHVPVAMTEKKYVRKPRGAPAGTVVIEREKLFFVNPQLPSGADDR